MVTSAAFKLSTASTEGDISAANTVAEVTIPVVIDGRIGPQGQGLPGKMFYSMGEWESHSYSRTDLLVPMVHYDDGEFSEATGQGNYYYLNADSASSSDVPGTSSKWTKATGFGVVITQGLFAEFAKLGKAIMSGDFMYSMNGSIDGTEYNNGDAISGAPGYTYFAGSHKGKGSFGGYSGSSRHVLFNFNFLKLLPGGASINITYSAKMSSSTGYVKIYKDGFTEVYSKYLTSTLISLTESISISEAGIYTIEYKGVGSSSVLNFVNIEYELSGVFVPNWYVDLLTGKMVAAKGNFVVEPNGNVEVSGTIRAKNFFHNVCVISGQNNYSYKKYYKGGNYSDDTSGDICTYDADVIYAFVRDGQTSDEPLVVLPDPEDFKGKMITVASTYNYNGTPPTFYIKCLGNGKMPEYVYTDQYEHITYGGNSFNNVKMATAGMTAAFVSLQLYNGTWCWVYTGTNWGLFTKSY